MVLSYMQCTSTLKGQKRDQTIDDRDMVSKKQVLYWKIPFCTDNPEKTRTVTKNILQIYFSLIFITTFYRKGRYCNSCVFKLWRYTRRYSCRLCTDMFHYFMPFFVIDRVGNCIIPSAAYHISCKITVKQLVKSQIRWCIAVSCGIVRCM